MIKKNLKTKRGEIDYNIGLPSIALLTAFPAISIDLSLPAIPLFQQIWNKPLGAANMTIGVFMLAYCIFLIFIGPISDRIGRRPVILTGIIVYMCGSLLCTVSLSLQYLVLSRFIQGAGAAGASSVSMAVCKDIFEGKRREQILAYVAIIMSLAPMLSPSIGSFLLRFFPWRAIFLTHVFMGTIALIVVLRMKETLQARSETSWKQTAGIYIKLFQNRFLTVYLIIISLSFLPIYSFLASSTDIYISNFGLSEQAFGIFFGLISFSLMIGSFACSRLVTFMDSKNLITLGFAGMALGGLSIVMFGDKGPWSFTLSMNIIFFSMGLCRPPLNNLALEHAGKYAGSASSTMLFLGIMVGILGMWIASHKWSSTIRVLDIFGIMCFFVGVSISLMWFFLKKSERRLDPS